MIMKTNYEILREIKEEINDFKYDMSDIETILSINKWEIADMYDKEPDLLESALVSVIEVKHLLDTTTYGMKSLLEESDIDFESFDWCVGKVLHCDAEIINYLESFENFLNDLEFAVENRLTVFEVLLESMPKEDAEQE